jgi:surface antigen
MMKKTIIVLSLALAATACVPPNNEQVGGVAGGVIGGLLGSQFGGGSGKIVAAVGGAVLGSVIGGRIGQTMDRLDRLELQRALESEPTGQTKMWTNPDTGNQYQVRPTHTYQNAQKQPCREYVTEAMIGGKKEKMYGKACRQADGSWKVAN